MGIRRMIVTIYDRLPAIVQSCDLEREICQTFQIVPRRVVRTNERTDERVEFARKEGCRSPFSGFEGREEEHSRTSAARWMFILLEVIWSKI